MVIGDFNYEKAQSKARIFLEESIFVLGKMMDVDPSNLDESSINPYEPHEPIHTAWECMKQEVLALKKLV
jgi:hypothetical protein